ncbi:HAD-IIIC family phosphatase [Phenylobacterium montanum]|uniref:HAD-IIIC family phosphatase n=1 Tax=Phenylobacterium montanum TaxID=2823693 RepID=A0A975G0N7_9CAUL|nr:HAD-IIIC family phosphatase [Caulobacter sp. S6]QUD88373.1 HAD-IIIC family phosphatase [Caulobacter sp. S6]
MILRLSRFIHLLPLGDERVLVIHAVSHLRLVVDQDLAGMIAFFAEPRELPPEQAGGGAFAALTERGILTDKTPEEELATVAAELGAYHGRDPEAMLERFRREAKEGPEPYWAAGAALGANDLAGEGQRLDVLLFGDCDIHMESDFLRREAAGRGLDLRIAATFPDDLRLAAERKHDAILVGALRARHTLTDPIADDQTPPFSLFIAQARLIIEGLRQHTAAPILIDNLPEPTVQPLGLADHGQYGHRNRFRLANVALASLAEAYPDVHVVDVAGHLAGAGAERLLDDAQVGYTHFGSPGWMLQRPDSEKAATHQIFPDTAPLAQLVGGDPYVRERVMAAAHVDALVSVLGVSRIKCVIVDLDNTLWPGVLAETGAPFAWSPEVSGPFSYIGLFFGLHEALKDLKRRGILLACVSKNDEATVRELWRYEDHYPAERLLTPDDFVTWRVNWEDKASNIRSIAAELGFADSAFLFIDDNPVERERVRQQLPEVEVWGEELFSLRRRLLTDPRLTPPRITEESAARTEATKAQLSRQQHRTAVADEAAFLASLDIRTRVARLAPGDPLERVEELFQRTTQFNTTGIKPKAGDLATLIAGPAGRVFTLHVADRFGDHGLVGAAVVAGGEILGLAMSCRVLGMGVEHTFLQAVLSDLAQDQAEASGRIIETPRNGPVRNIYRDNGFALGEDQVWRRRLAG